MKGTLRWLRLGLAILLFAGTLAWLVGQGEEWRFRYSAAKLLQNVKAIRVGYSSPEEARRLLSSWGDKDHVFGGCFGNECRYFVNIDNGLTFLASMDAGPEHFQFFHHLLDSLALRPSSAGAGFMWNGDLITEKTFAASTSLPVQDWFVRDGAYVPDLVISSSEVTQFRISDISTTNDKNVSARNVKGPYGITIKFLPQESSDQQAALMNFRFSCFTTLVPCSSESDLLPAASGLIKQK